MIQGSRTVQYRVGVAAGTVGLTVLLASQLVVQPVPTASRETEAVIQPVSAMAPNGTPGWIRPLMDDPHYPEGSLLDLSISSIRSLSYRNRTGTYPTGRVGLAMETTSCNVGNTGIPFFAAMDPDHPFIAQNLYRVQDGHFEQIGMAWLKHAFFAADAPGCGNCQINFFDDLLNVGCQDTYGVSNNSDRTWLGPRSELDPFTSTWDPCGSHFDGTPVDCVRHHGSNGHGAIDHMLRVDDADLDHSDATYYYEGMYYTREDLHVYNNAAWRECTFTPNGNSWNISTVGGQTASPAIMTWGLQHDIASPRHAGDVIVGVNVIDLGNGSYRYIYAVYNHNFADQIQSFNVPFQSGTNISNVGFHAPLEEEDVYDTADWGNSVNATDIRWDTDTFAVNEFANSLRFGTAYTFSFDADSAPELTTVTMDVFQPNGIAQLTTSTLGPAGGVQSGLAMTVPQISRGFNGDAVVQGAQPGETVHFLYSLKSMGQTYAPQIDMLLDLRAGIQYGGNAIANGSGVATFSFNIPPTAPRGQVGIQSVVNRGPGSSLKSNIEIRNIN